jgi:hypothetical protein
MIYWTLQIAIVSIVLIFMVHHLIHYFKNTLTVPKFVDLVNTTPQKYEKIFHCISKNRDNGGGGEVETKQKITTQQKIEIDLLKNELHDFLKTQTSSNSSTTSIQQLPINEKGLEQLDIDNYAFIK